MRFGRVTHGDSGQGDTGYAGADRFRDAPADDSHADDADI